MNKPMSTKEMPCDKCLTPRACEEFRKEHDGMVNPFLCVKGLRNEKKYYNRLMLCVASKGRSR